MKKTIITALLALGLAAGASATDVTADYSYTLADFSGSGAQTLKADSSNYSNIVSDNHQFTMTLVLDWEFLSSMTETATYRTAELSYNNNISTKVSLGIRTDSSGTHLKLAQSNTDLLTLTLTEDYVRDGLVTVTMTVDTNNDANRFRMLVLNKEENGTDWVATAAVHSEGASSASTTYRGTNEFNQVWLNGATKGAIKALYISDENTSDLASLAESAYAANIPEPTTATLSLLALAGLAARRRRK